MKTTLAFLLLVPAAFATAQRGDWGRGDWGRNDWGRDSDRDAQGIEGVYEASQRDGTLRRTLRLDRNGDVEIVTEAINARRGWDRADVRRYGRVADVALDERTVRQRGQWRVKNGDVTLWLDGFRLDNRREKDLEVKLKWDKRTLVLDKNTDLYGESRIEFRRTSGWDGGRPSQSRPRLGYLRYDRESLPIEDVEYVDGRRGAGRLRFRAGGRLVEVRGDAVRNGNEVAFNMMDGAGGFRLSLRDGRVDRIRGNGSVDRHRIEIVDRQRD